MSEPLRDAGHLPNRRPGGRPAPPECLPRHRNGIAPQMRSRYPDYNVLDEAGHWDELTRRAIMQRVEQPPAIRFFDEREVACLEAFCDTVLAQDREPRVPVINMVDAKLAAGRGDGFQHAGMPTDAETWRIVAEALDHSAREHGAAGFAAASDEQRVEIVGAFANGDVAGGAWERVRPSLAWGVVMRSVLEAFYSHPWAWNEIGFGGPAYPRGYARLAPGLREGWEKPEELDIDPVRDVKERGLP
jgi:Gluconate 2-dehydrogenase subunit 3